MISDRECLKRSLHMNVTTSAVMTCVFAVRVVSGAGVGIEPIVPIGFFFVAVSAAMLRWDVRHVFEESLPGSINAGVGLIHGATCMFLTACILTEFNGILAGPDENGFWTWSSVVFIGISAHGIRRISKGLLATSVS